VEPSQHDPTLETSEASLAESGWAIYIFRLYVTGSTPRSIRAIRNLTQLCQEHLAGRYTLEVIDLYQHPELAQAEDIIAAPTLLKQLPLPIQKLIGDLSNEQQLVASLGLMETLNTHRDIERE
jgi:circadian clock protein KaiB